MGTQVLDKGIVFLTGTFDPDDIIEEKLLRVRGGQALQAQVWPMHQHFAQFTDF